MVHITNPSNERIDNIRTFLQGKNPIGLGNEIVKALLTMEAACGELVSNEQAKRLSRENVPQLIKPKMMAMKMQPHTMGNMTSEKGFNANAVLIESFASLRQLLHEGKIGELASRLQILNHESESKRNQGEVLLNSFAKSTDELAQSKQKGVELTKKYNVEASKLDALQQKLPTLEIQIKENKSALQIQQNALAFTQASLSSLPTPAVTFEDKQMFTELTQLESELVTDITQLGKQQNILSSQFSALNTEIDTLLNDLTVINTQRTDVLKQATELAKVANNERESLNKFIESSPQRIEIDGEKWENTLALLTMLTAQLKKAMNEDSLRNMKEQEEVMTAISEASRKDSDKKAKEAAEAERKAADANKAASCASKIFSYVMLAVSVIATVATFGAAAPLTLAIAAIGIAMSVADIVLEETGNGSLMQMLATEISSAVTDMLITFGVPEEEAKKIGSIVGMVLAAVAFLALSLVSMSSFVKNMANTVSNVAKTIVKNAGTLLKSTIKSMPKSLTNALGNIATKTTKAGQSIVDNTDEMVKLTKFTQLADQFDDAKDISKAVSQAVDKIDKSADLVSIGGQMVKVGDSVADSADSVVKLTKFTQLADKFDDVKNISKAVSQAVDKVDKSADLVSIGGQMVKVGDRVTDSTVNVAKLAKVSKLADNVDDVQDIAKATDKMVTSAKTQSVAMARLEVGMKGTGAGLSVANAATTGGLHLHSAAQMRDMKEMLAGMMLNNETIQALDELLNALIKAMSKNYEQLDEMFTGMLTSLKQSGQAKVDMLKTARFA